MFLEPYGRHPEGEGSAHEAAHEAYPAVPLELEAAFEKNADLRDALMQSDMPLRFQAMVLGLATLRQSNTDHRRS